MVYTVFMNFPNEWKTKGFGWISVRKESCLLKELCLTLNNSKYLFLATDVQRSLIYLGVFRRKRQRTCLFSRAPIKVPLGDFQEILAYPNKILELQIFGLLGNSKHLNSMLLNLTWLLWEFTTTEEHTNVQKYHNRWLDHRIYYPYYPSFLSSAS